MDGSGAMRILAWLICGAAILIVVIALLGAIGKI